jgi:two-component system, cell cycle sensor histidine kinase and response regulator CckA
MAANLLRRGVPHEVVIRRAEEMIEQAVLDPTSNPTKEAAAFCRPPRRSDGKETILFVEDETFVREVAGEVLRSAGYRVLAARDAAAALRAYDLEGGDVDLLLTDIILPGESGRALAGKLKRKSPRLKVLLMSGYSEQMGLQETDAGSCLPKPFSVATLLQKVGQVLNRREALDSVAS